MSSAMNIKINKAAIRSVQLRQMLATSNVAIATGTLLALVLAWTQHEVINPAVVIVWFSLIALVSVVRSALAYCYRRFPVEDASVNHSRLARFRLGVLVSGLVWGSAGFLMFPAHDPQHQMFLVFMLAGLTAGGVVSYSADLVSAISFSVLALVPLIVRLIAEGESLSVEMGVAGMLYLGFMVVTLRYIHTNVTEYIVLRLEAKAREESVRASEERYRLLLAHLPVGIFHYDTDLVITYCNERFANILNQSADYFIGWDLKLVSDQSVLPALRNALEGENSQYVGQYHATSSDISVWADMTCAPLMDSSGKIVGGIAIVQDISERKQAEIEIERSRQELDEEHLLFQTILDNAPIGIWMLGVDNRIKFINQTFCNSVGVTEQQFISANHYSDILPPSVSANCIKSDRECFGNEALHISMEWLPFVDGKDHLLEITKVRLSDLDGRTIGLIALATDITERKHLENELRESRQILRKLVAKAEILREEERKHIAREVHDELGSILTALRMDVALINLRFGEQDAALFEKTQGMTELLDQAGRCVGNIVTNLRPMALDMGVVPAVDWLCNEYSSRTGSACVLHATSEDVDLDEALAVAVFRMVQELLTNVARHAEANRVEITLAQHDDEFHVQVRDDGKGFDLAAKEKNKTFGLLGVRERAIAWGGYIKVVSAPDLGTVVTITLPTKPNRGNK